jgi:PKD repeat protein
LLLLGIVLLIGCAGAQAPTAAFSGTPTSGVIPLNVAFTDLSTGGPTGWAWFFGDENFTAPWSLVNASPGWLARRWHSSVVMPDGSIVLTGGQAIDGSKNDTWKSANNGTTWTQVNASSGWPARYGHSSVALSDGNIVLMGGYDGTNYMNDVWRSTDNGTTWALVNASPGWSVRNFFSSVVLPDGSIVLMGGLSQFGQAEQDVWRSTDDGSTWGRVTPSAQWAARSEFSSVVLPDGSIVLTGGADNVIGYENETWRSTDGGATWTEMNTSSGWPVRNEHASVAMPDGSIVLMGGWNPSTGFLNDVWRSTNNGSTWTDINASAGWTPRGSHTGMAMADGSIVLTGGAGTGGDTNETWQFVPKGSSAQNPSHIYNTPGSYQVTLQAYNINGFNSTRKAGYINVVPPVVADFWGTPTFGPAPLDVAFMDNSTGQPISWNWTFGDGNFSHLQNPVHRYLTNGNFTVSLNVTNVQGSNNLILTKYIQVTPPLAPPVIKSITPTTGVRNSTVSFTILGNNFQAGHTTAEFRNQSSGLITASLSFINATNLTGTVAIPANASTGLWNIRVVTTTNGEAILMNAFTIKNASPPTIAAITPPSPWYRNASVKFLITGTNFQPGKTTINFTYPSNGTQLNLTLDMKILIINTTAINGTVVIPYNASAVAMNVSVTTVDGGRVWKASAFTVAPFPAPTIASVAPSTPWYRNASVFFLITGTNFQPGQTIVNFTYPSNGTELNLTPGMRIQTITTTTINGTVVVPYNASAVALNVSVRTLDGGRVWKPAAFTVAVSPAPTIASVTPTTPWYRNASVKFLITGTNFQPGHTIVNFTYPSNGTQLNLTQGMKILIINTTAINGTVVIPYNASAVALNVSVRTLDGGRVWKASAFTIAPFPAPTIVSVAPTTPWYRNASVFFLITGTNFQPGQTAVNFTYPSNGTELNVTGMKIQTITTTTINGTVVVPYNASAVTMNVSVRTLDGGRAWKPAAFTVAQFPAPTIGAITPASGFRNTTVAFTITGTNFLPGQTTVNLSYPANSEISTTLYAVSSTQIIGGMRVPGNATNGAWKLNVTTLDGGLTTRPSAFTISKLPAPAVTAFAPSAAYRGTTVSFIVNGSYFEPGGLTIVNLTKPGQVDISTNLTTVYSSQIAGNFTIPSGYATGLWNVNVSTIDGNFVTKASALSVL